MYSILTPNGYKDLSNVNIGDELLCYDFITGETRINHLLSKTLINKDNWKYDLYSHTEETLLRIECTGFNAITGEFDFKPVYEYKEVYDPNPFDFYIINKAQRRFKYESIWTKNTDGSYYIKHIQDLRIGDIIIDGSDKEIVVNTIALSQGTTSDVFYKLEVDGDHSYISGDITFHNASRYWNNTLGYTVNWATNGSVWFAEDTHITTTNAPAVIDYAYFTVNSTGACQIGSTSYCGGVDFTGFANTFTGINKLYCTGDFLLSSTMTLSFTGTLYMNISSSIANFKTAGKTIGFTINLQNNVTLKFLDDIYSESATLFAVASGDTDPNGKKVTMGGTGALKNIAPVTFYDLEVTASSSNGATVSIGGSLHGAIIKSSINIQGYSTAKKTLLNSSSNPTTARIYLDGAATATLANIDVFGIHGLSSGGNTWWANNVLTGCGDCGNNTNLLFEAPIDAYFVSGGQNRSWTDSCWFSSSGGSTPVRVPLVHDIVHIDSNSLNNLEINVPRIGTINFTGAPNISITATTQGNALSYFGNDIVFSPDMSFNISLSILGIGKTVNITSNGKILPSLRIDNATGSFILNDDLTINGTIDIVSGTFSNTNNHILTCKYINAEYVNNRTINWGDGSKEVILNVTSNGAGILNLRNTNLTLSGTANIKVVASNGVNNCYISGNRQINRLTLTGQANYNLRYGDSGFVVNELIFDISENAKGMEIASGHTQYFYKITAIGSPTRNITIKGQTAGSRGTIDLRAAKHYCDYLYIKDIAATNGTLYAGSHSVDGTNNTGVTFSSGMNSSFLSALMSM